jgi:hypothetical protein
MKSAEVKKKEEFTNMIKEKWTYLDERDGDFPEAWVLNFSRNKLKVEVNREKKQVRIYAETDGGDRIESSITNGIVIEERDLNTGTKANLIEEFTNLGKYLSAIPDSKLVRLIGGNYGVISEFIQFVGQHANKDMMILKAMGLSIILIPVKILAAFLDWSKDIVSKPRMTDIVDAAVVVGGGYLTYLWNFDFALSGFVVMTGAVLTGYIDWFIRRKNPYVLKVLVTFLPASYFLLAGLRYQ